MSNCKYCGINIPKTRIHENNRTIYCSIKCNQRAWIDRKNSKITHFYLNSQDWLKTCTGKGWLWEKFIANLINGKWQGFGKPVDIICNGEKIDVKSCELYKRKKKRGKEINQEIQSGWWVFNRNKNVGCDFFICIGLINGIPQKIFKIPNNVFKKGLVISPHKSKYNQYLISY